MTRRRGLVAAVAAGLLVALWIGGAAVQRGQVDVDRSGPIECTGSEVVEVPDLDEVPFEAIRMTPGMHCLVPVEVTNDGWLPVTVEGALLPFMGPGGGAGVQSERLRGEGPVEPPDDPSLDAAGDRDAYFVVERPLSRGESIELVLEFTFRPDGCTSEDAVMWHDAMPEVVVETLWLDGTRAPNERLSFQGTRQSSCDS